MNDFNHSETRRQELSALMDGEVGHDRAKFALRSISEDAAVAAQWDRLHLLRHYLRETEVQPVAADFLAGLRARIDSEAGTDAAGQQQTTDCDIPVTADAASAFSTGWRQQAAGMALAASVAMLALFGFNALVLAPGQPQTTDTAAMLANQADNGNRTQAGKTEDAQTFTPRGNMLQDQFSATAIPVNYTRDEAAGFRQQLNDYMLRHSQLASGSGRVGFTAYAPLLSADVEWQDGQVNAVMQTVGAGTDQGQAGPVSETPASRH